MQDLTTLKVEELTPLTPDVISRQATINIGTRAASPARGPAPSAHSTTLLTTGFSPTCFRASLNRQSCDVALSWAAGQSAVVIICPARRCHKGTFCYAHPASAFQEGATVVS